jgi:transcriptional regulator with XRE-family HTH domain
MELEKNLPKYCKQKGLTLAALARQSGVKQPTLFGWTTGRKVQKLDELRKVCEVLEVSLHMMLFSVPDPFEGKEGFIKDFIWGDVRITMHLIQKEK